MRMIEALGYAACFPPLVGSRRLVPIPSLAALLLRAQAPGTPWKGLQWGLKRPRIVSWCVYIYI